MIVIASENLYKATLSARYGYKHIISLLVVRIVQFDRLCNEIILCISVSLHRLYRSFVLNLKWLL